MNRSGTPPSVPATSASPPQALEDTQLDDVMGGAQSQQARRVTIVQEIKPAELQLSSGASPPAGRTP